MFLRTFLPRTCFSFLMVLLPAFSLSCAPIVISSIISDASEDSLVRLLVASSVIPPERSGNVGLLLDQQSLTVLVVPGSPADAAGIKEGDLLLSINDMNVSAFDDLSLLAGPPETTVRVELSRNGEVVEYELMRELWWNIPTFKSRHAEHKRVIDPRPGFSD